MSTEEKFRAAVNVIKSLPKSAAKIPKGPWSSYQPSYDVMLKFYSYFKQATEGKCKGGRPGVWNPVARVKWDAWNKLGDMPSEKAMELYVTDLQKIVETMAYTDNVAAFFDTVDDESIYPPIPRGDLELVAGDILKRARSPNSSTESSSENTPLKSVPMTNGHNDSDDSRITQESLQNGQCDSEDEFADTVDSEDSEIPAVHVHENGHIPNGHVARHRDSLESAVCIKTNELNIRVLDELRRTIACLEKDMSSLKGKVNSMEKEKYNREKSLLWSKPEWWPIPGVSPALVAFLILWPIVANQIVATLRRKRQL